MDEIYFFSGQIAECQNILSKTSQNKKDAIAERFLETALGVIKDEVASNPILTKAELNFNSLRELMDQRWKSDEKDTALDSALICASQLACFINTFEKRSPSYLEVSDRIRIVGQSVGLIAASAVAAASSLESLLLLGSEATRTAFRYGLQSKSDGARTCSAEDLQRVIPPSARDAFSSKESRFNVYPNFDSEALARKKAIELLEEAVREAMTQPPTVGQATAAAPSAAPRKWLSTSVQSIISEVVDVKAQTATVIAESDFADPKLFPVIAGHVMRGQGFCPSTLYADICYTLAQYGYQLLRPNEGAYIDVGALDCPTPILVDVQNRKSHVYKAECEISIPLQQATFKLTTFNGQKDVLHCKCVARFEDPALWEEEWARSAYLIQSRADHLQRKFKADEADLITRKMVYKLFSVLVDYTDIYQGMENILFDGPEFEAYATIRFKAGVNDGTFMMNPYYIDNLSQLTGFTVNATVDGEKECFINHGWQSLRVLQKIDPEKTYYSYVKMQPVQGSKMREGDLWMFNDKKEVIGLAKGIRFQCVPQKLMSVLIPAPKKSKSEKVPVK